MFLHYLRAVTHEHYMQRCLELALNAGGDAAPNPMVGAVLVHEGRVIGEGWHKKYGQAHAEVNCLESVAGADCALIPESTMYVSLEPCAHHGKTPPCAERIIREGIRKVVVANTDPFEKVGGKGIRLLREAGVEVITGVLETEGRWLNRRFFCCHEQQQPYVILKWAESADGFFAPADRSRLQLSNGLSQRLVHRWRSEEMAILVGYTTALRDNPRLTARMWPGSNPLRIVIDRQLSLPPHLHLFSEEAPTWIVNERKEGSEGHLHYVQLPFDDQILVQLLHRLYRAGCLSLIVEGGAMLLEGFIAGQLWQEARIFHTPSVIGEGLAAPRLGHASLLSRQMLAEDELKQWTSPHNNFVQPGHLYRTAL